MPVIQPGQPSVAVQVPVPTPVRPSPKQAAQRPMLPALPKPVPPSLKAIIMPYTPGVKRMRRGVKKYAAPGDTEGAIHENMIYGDTHPKNDNTQHLAYFDWLQEHVSTKLAEALRRGLTEQSNFNGGIHTDSTTLGRDYPTTYQSLGYAGKLHLGIAKPTAGHVVIAATPQEAFKDKAVTNGIPFHYRTNLTADEAHDLADELRDKFAVGGEMKNYLLRRVLRDTRKMSRLPKKVIKYSVQSSSLRQLLKAARQNPYESTIHGQVADELDEQYPGNHIGEMIRKQFGLTGGEPKNNDWYEPVENSWDGTFPYAARIGKHGPFNLYLRHEGNEGQTNKWVVHAVSSFPETRDTGYSFEFPHEEAHLIPRLFPEAKKYIEPNEFRSDSSVVSPEGKVLSSGSPGSPNANRLRSLTGHRNEEARRFDEMMDEMERNRE